MYLKTFLLCFLPCCQTGCSCCCTSCVQNSVSVWDCASFGSGLSFLNTFIFAIVVFVYMYYKSLFDNKLKSDEMLGMVRSMVHATEVPLTLIRGLLEEITVEGYSEKKINQALQHLTAAINCYHNVRSLDKLEESIAHGMEATELELSAFVTSVADHCRAHAEHCGVRLAVHKDFAYNSCHINKVFMTAALGCLLDKVIDITPAGATIDIVASQSEACWSVGITNDSSSDRKVKYSRIFNLLAACVPVCGCGSLCGIRKVIRLHGGRLSGRKHGQAVAFEIVIPSQALCKPSEDAAMEEKGTAEDDADSCAFPHVLLVMADKELGAYLRGRLSTAFRVTLLDHPEQVCLFSADCHPGAVIIDEAVDGRRGGEICSRLKADDALADIPVILLAHFADDKDYSACLGCGADKVELRTVHAGKLAVDVRVLIERRNLRYERFKKIGAALSISVNQEFTEEEDDAALFIKKLQEVIDKNLTTDKYNIKQLCAEVGMSRTSFYNRLKTLTGQAPSDYIFNYKMEKAKMLLTTRKYSVTDIANMLGFCDAKYFGKRFKGVYAIPPSQFADSVTE